MNPDGLEENLLPKNPNLELIELRHLLSLTENWENTELKSKLFDAMCKDAMAPFYQQTCHVLHWSIDEAVLANMIEQNESDLKKIDDDIVEAEKNFGQQELRAAYVKKAEYLCRIGNREYAEQVFQKAYEAALALESRLDIVFYLIRLGFFVNDHQMVGSNIEKAEELIDKLEDWERRNRLKVYQGTHALSVRDFKQAVECFLFTLSAFQSYELMDYDTFIRYTVYIAMVALPREHLQERVIKNVEIQQGLHALPDVKSYLYSLYTCQYAEFFLNLAKVEQRMRRDYLLYPHYRFYVREMRLIAYSQLLSSYRSVTLKHFAESFGVDEEYIENELMSFIAPGRLFAKIDRVRGVVESNRSDSRGWLLQGVMKQGDTLFNRIQNLSRSIDK